MPGTPHHALGGPLETAVVATVTAGACTAGLIAGARAGVSRRRLGAAGGLGYAAVLLTLWATVRLLFWRFPGVPAGIEGTRLFVAVVGAVTVVLLAQWAAVTVLFVSYRLWTAVVWLFATGWVTAYTYLQVGGESGGVFLLLLWALSIGPGLLVGLGLLAAGEAAVRRLLRARQEPT